MPSDIRKVTSGVSTEKIKRHVLSLEGLRHAWENHDALEERAGFIEETLRSLNLIVEEQDVPFYGRMYRNIIATMKGTDEDRGWILLGSHYDAASGSPGADDNASGVAALLEAARCLSRQELSSTVQFAAFTLEEPQPQTFKFLIGSDHFAKEARRLKRRYDAVLILESVGYTDRTEGSQIVPPFVRVHVPKTGDFLGVVSNNRSKSLMEEFHKMAGEYVPELRIVPYKVPLSGYVVPESRFSDHASFWDQRYPALMLTDTAMFRNPNYHTPNDRHETLDFEFITNVTKAVISTILHLGGYEP